MSSWRGSATVSVLVALVVLLGGLQLVVAQPGGKFGPRLGERLRERRLERIRLRQQRVAESIAHDYPAVADYQDDAGVRSSQENGTSSSEDYDMNLTGTVDANRKPLPIAFRPSLRRTKFEKSILFRFYHDGNLTKQTTMIEDEPLLNGTGCAPDERFALIVHGWHENCYEVPWVLDLRENLRTYRGGCVACMDYSSFSSGGYGGLVGVFRDIRDVLQQFLQQLRFEGIQYERLFLFGFSFGAQLALDVGTRIGGREIEAIDTCDMAGPGFDNDRLFKQADFRQAAKNVQCIHTSIDKGTKFPNKCHQNWRMGQCGLRQAAAGPPPLGSHGLCPVFYNLAFKYQFLAQPKPLECVSLGDTAGYPRNYRMGYMESRKSEVRGELFAQTSDVYPYTVFTNPYNIFDYGF
ncbi:uncharacterized protein LOC128732102 [Anopheles nili]|uniref:uncharacterized protein LOC128732102 n=1 Tax=Anopheles nili TaxID=185578 RepID=UPI00237ADDD4|nr:uncharacterized protein LOC128732102 [Anopheles nili]